MILLEKLTDSSITQRNFERLAALVIDTGARELAIRWGVASVVFSGAAFTPTITVPHGLGRLPVGVWVTPATVSDFRLVAFVSSDTEFTVTGWTDSAYTGALSFCWLVIG